MIDGVELVLCVAHEEGVSRALHHDAGIVVSVFVIGAEDRVVGVFDPRGSGLRVAAVPGDLSEAVVRPVAAAAVDDVDLSVLAVERGRALDDGGIVFALPVARVDLFPVLRGVEDRRRLACELPRGLQSGDHDLLAECSRAAVLLGDPHRIDAFVGAAFNAENAHAAGPLGDDAAASVEDGLRLVGRAVRRMAVRAFRRLAVLRFQRDHADVGGVVPLLAQSKEHVPTGIVRAEVVGGEIMQLGRPGAAQLRVNEGIRRRRVLRAAVDEVLRERQRAEAVKRRGAEQRDVGRAGHGEVIQAVCVEEAGVCHARAEQRAGKRVGDAVLDHAGERRRQDEARPEAAAARVSVDAGEAGEVAAEQADRALAAQRTAVEDRQADRAADLAAVHRQRAVGGGYRRAGHREEADVCYAAAVYRDVKPRAGRACARTADLQKFGDAAAVYHDAAALQDRTRTRIAAAYALPGAAVNGQPAARKGGGGGVARHDAGVIVAGLPTGDRVVEMHVMSAAGNGAVSADIVEADVLDVHITVQRQVAVHPEHVSAAVDRDAGAVLGERKRRSQRNVTRKPDGAAGRGQG